MRLRVLFALMFVLALSPLSTLVSLADDEIVPNGVQRVGAPSAASDPLGDRDPITVDVNVAVVDTGVDTQHPDLNVVGGVDCSPKSSPSPYGSADLKFTTLDVKDPSNPFGPITPAADAPGWQDGMGHGTHVAGTIGAKDNGLGVVGVAPGANIFAVKVLGNDGSGTVESIVCGLEWIVRNQDRNQIDVVNMSLGLHTNEPIILPGCDTPLKSDASETTRLLRTMQLALCEVTDLGIPVIVAAGNDDGTANANFPATLSNVTTISNYSDFDGKPGALAENLACPALGGWDDALWTHWNGTPYREMSSSNGSDVDFAAPGTCIISTLPGAWGKHGGSYGTATGTSMASPHVAGLVALFKADNPQATNQEVRNWLRASAEKQEQSFHDTDAFHESLARYGVTEIVKVVREQCADARWIGCE